MARLSATAFTGRFSISRILNVTSARFDRIAPRHLLGLKGEIGVKASRGASIGRIGPCADKLYADEPAGVAISTPSHTSSFKRALPSTWISIFAAWCDARSNDTSFNAKSAELFTVLILCAHLQRMDFGGLCIVQSVVQIIEPKIIH